MPIYIGNKELLSRYVGVNVVDRIMLGSVEIWERNPYNRYLYVFGDSGRDDTHILDEDTFAIIANGKVPFIAYRYASDFIGTENTMFAVTTYLNNNAVYSIDRDTLLATGFQFDYPNTKAEGGSKNHTFRVDTSSKKCIQCDPITLLQTAEGPVVRSNGREGGGDELHFYISDDSDTGYLEQIDSETLVSLNAIIPHDKGFTSHDPAGTRRHIYILTVSSSEGNTVYELDPSTLLIANTFIGPAGKITIGDGGK